MLNCLKRPRNIAVITILFLTLIALAVDPALMIGPLRKLAVLPIAAGLAVLFSVWLDQRGGIDFPSTMATASADARLNYLGRRALAIGIAVAGAMMGCICLLIVAAAPAQALTITKAYDRPIKQACEEFTPSLPPMLCKGQWYQESRLDPQACSHAGACGLPQLMPGTARDMARVLGYGTLDRHSIEPALRAGSAYMKRMLAIWSSPRPWWDKVALALASYNAGPGNIISAQRLAGGAVLYAPIMAELHRVTGRHAAETRGYAPAIRRWWMLLEAGA